jgi:hypothetical protein
MDTKNTKKAKFTPKKGWENAVHAKIDKEVWNKGERLSTPYVCTFTSVKEWTDFVRNPLGFTIIEVLYVPKNFPTMEEIKTKKRKK